MKFKDKTAIVSGGGAGIGEGIARCLAAEGANIAVVDVHRGNAERVAEVVRSMGRKADTIRFGPRVLDLDILLYDDRVIRTPRLEIPHPRMHKRAFVLQPICDIDPTIIHPVLGQTASDLLSHLADDDQRVIALENQPNCI